MYARLYSHNVIQHTALAQLDRYYYTITTTIIITINITINITSPAHETLQEAYTAWFVLPLLPSSSLFFPLLPVSPER